MKSKLKTKTGRRIGKIQRSVTWEVLKQILPSRYLLFPIKNTPKNWDFFRISAFQMDWSCFCKYLEGNPFWSSFSWSQIKLLRLKWYSLVKIYLHKNLFLNLFMTNLGSDLAGLILNYRCDFNFPGGKMGIQCGKFHSMLRNVINYSLFYRFYWIIILPEFSAAFWGILLYWKPQIQPHALTFLSFF